MLIKEAFSNLYNESITKAPVWELECDFEDESILSIIEILFQSELMELFKFNRASEKVVPIIHLHFDQIIERKKANKIKEHEEIFNFLQFVWGLSAVTQLNQDGEFVYCYEIFMKSVFDKSYKNGETYDLNDIKIFQFEDSKNEYISNTRSIIDQWFSQLFYYSKSFSGLNDWCSYYFDDIYYELNENLSIEFYHPQYLSNILSWCEVNLNSKGSRAIRNIVEREYFALNWDGEPSTLEIKSSLGLQLVLCKDYKRDEKATLFHELDSNFDFHPLARMQAFIALCYDEESLNRHYKQLLDSIALYNVFLSEQNLNVISLIYERAKVFKNLLNSVIGVVSTRVNAQLIDGLLLAYYDVKETQTIGSNVYITPNQLGRIAYCFGDKILFDEKDSQKLLTEIINIENEAFNTFRLLKGGVKQKFIVTHKPVGFPMPTLAKKYEDKLFELYDFSKLVDELQHAKSMSQFDFNSFPLQALMLKSIGKTLPINLSLSKKNSFPELEKILFWSGFSQTSEIEMEALKEIFESKNIEFEIHNEENSNLEKFLSRIEEINPEIIWFSSHGEYQHYEPNVSEIKLSEKESIGIRDFELLVNKTDKRRLIFLNVCEGRVHSQTGEFKNLGFPNLLVSSNQDIISHLWMAEPRFAYVFGVFFALGITHLQKNFFDSFQYSLLIVLSNKATILDELENFPLELFSFKERIINNDGTEWGNIITTGSPVYNI